VKLFSSCRYFGDYLYATGPGFFDAALRRYQAQPPSTHTAESRVTVLPPFYFLPTYDPSESDVISGKCFPTLLRRLPAEAQLVCRQVCGLTFTAQSTPASFMSRLLYILFHHTANLACYTAQKLWL